MSVAVRSLPTQEPEDAVPEDVRRALFNFLLDNNNGNFVLNVKDGRIVGWNVQTYHTLTKTP